MRGSAGVIVAQRKTGWDHRLLRAAWASVLVVSGSWPGGSGLAQVVLGPAQAELKRVSAKLNAAMKSGRATDLVGAVDDAEQAINNAQTLPTDRLDAAIKSAKTLYAKAYLQFVGQLVRSCEKGQREDGQAARTFLGKVESGAGNVADATAIKAYRGRLNKCLPVLKYEGKYHFKSKLATSSQSYVATVTWTLWQSLPGGIRTYRASGTINATGTSDTCSGSLKTDIDSDLSLLTVNEITAAGQSIPNTYMFALSTRNPIKMTCPKGATQEEPLLGAESCESNAYADINRLVGSCKDALIDASWLFEAVNDAP